MRLNYGSKFGYKVVKIEAMMKWIKSKYFLYEWQNTAGVTLLISGDCNSGTLQNLTVGRRHGDASYCTANIANAGTDEGPFCQVVSALRAAYIPEFI